MELRFLRRIGNETRRDRKRNVSIQNYNITPVEITAAKRQGVWIYLDIYKIKEEDEKRS